MKQLYGRVTVSMRALLIHRLIDLFDLMRMKRAGVPGKQARKALHRAQGRRFYRRVIFPEMMTLAADMAWHACQYRNPLRRVIDEQLQRESIAHLLPRYEQRDGYRVRVRP